MDILTMMKQYARHVRSGPGRRIIEEGSYGDSFFCIISGRVKVSRRIGETEETLRELHPGDFFGELALIHDKPRAATVTALDETELYEMGRESFTEMLRTSPDITMEILSTSSNWLLESDRQNIERLREQTRELAVLLQLKDQLTVSLAQEKEKYQSLVEHSLVGVFVVQDSKIAFANNRFCEMSGYQSVTEAQSIPLEDIMIGGSRVSLVGEGGGSDIEHYEMKIRTAPGEEKVWEIRSVPIVMNNARAILANAVDLTEKKRLEEENERTRMQLMQESKLAAIGFLAAGIAHNLNNPLSSIFSVAQVLKQEHPDMEEADRIIRQCRIMTNIIKNLMVKSRMDQSDELMPIDINSLLDTELKIYEAHLDFKHNVMKEYLLGENLPSIRGVYSDFSQAVMNIVQNAVDAMHNSPIKKLTVKTYADDRHVFIEIGDTGCGIPPENLDKIFVPFFTTKPLMSEKKGVEPTGTGLGLASSLQLMQKYNGMVQVKSLSGHGTTVTIAIPL
ncbi:MAG TPA: cyclic nucleotide-binding domain-containing protein [Deltaproteobacteria bacterium]|nr:cyclic nucleotide-binding domain-containing protein [Deltaproteobacteria bacterium]HPR54518.1 cyclic nucleotide-binding domain-containing protein [Deltaproteobacteria bacterium]HXK48592.1 cyclic nucleotide-binding domain-containing protein [Deltaproteobacteria bacterium]